MNATDRPRLTVRSPADLITAVPYLIGFHPTDSIVVVAMRGRRIVFAARADLPEPGADPTLPARHLGDVIGRQDAESTTVIGFGPPERVTPTVDAVRSALVAIGLPVLDALRVTDRRYWSYLCEAPDCCPPDGTPYDPDVSQVAAAAVYAGQVALPDRAALTAQVAPAEGIDRVALRRAGDRAERRLLQQLEAAPATDEFGERTIRKSGVAAVRQAQRRHRRGERLTDDEVAWLTLLLTHLPVRDHAWERTDGREEDITFWSEVLRRTEEELVPAPSCLLAFAAWRAGQGALAAVALERALTTRPDYTLALLLDDLLRRGVPPSDLDGWPAVTEPGVLRPRRRRPRRRR
ncbi:DUF4192 domain-containing protein [Micromonospora matsumotoense]|uniref:DUF4192 domain-containing protein n=1 Tax=Micromonospora matsumotoense TaxID=121616 RepID=UPI0034131B47